MPTGEPLLDVPEALTAAFNAAAPTLTKRFEAVWAFVPEVNLEMLNDGGLQVFVTPLTDGHENQARGLYLNTVGLVVGVLQKVEGTSNAELTPLYLFVKALKRIATGPINVGPITVHGKILTDPISDGVELSNLLFDSKFIVTFQVTNRA